MSSETKDSSMMDETPSRQQQTETIRILASIQTTNEFILRGMSELKVEMGKVAEVVQAHAIMLQAHSTDLTIAKANALEAVERVNVIDKRLAVLEGGSATAAAKPWSTDNIKVILLFGSIIYLCLEVLKLALTAIVHPAASSAIDAAAKAVK